MLYFLVSAVSEGIRREKILSNLIINLNIVERKRRRREVEEENELIFV